MALQSAMKSGLIKLRPLLNRSATQYIKQRTEILKWVLVIQAERVSLCACIKCLLWEIDHLSMEERYEMGRSLSHSAWRALCESAEDCMRLSPARCLCMEPSKCLRALFGDATRLFLQARSELLATEDSLETQLGLVDAARAKYTLRPDSVSQKRMKALFLDEGRAIELASFKIQRDHFTALIYAAIERRKASTRSSDTDTQNAIKYFASLRVLATGFHTILSERFPCKDHECLSDEDCSITIELEDRLDGRISAGAVGPVGAEFKVLLGHCRVQDRQWKLVVGRITEANAASVGLDAQLAVIARNYSAAGLANRIESLPDATAAGRERKKCNQRLQGQLTEKAQSSSTEVQRLSVGSAAEAGAHNDPFSTERFCEFFLKSIEAQTPLSKSQMIYRSKHFMLTAGQPIGIELVPDERPFLPLQRLFGGYQGHKHLLWQSPLLSDNTRRLCIAFHFAQALLYLYDAGWIAQGWQFPDLEIVNHPETGLQPLLTIVAHQTSFHAGNRNRLVLDPAGAGPTATRSSLGSLRPAAEVSPPDHWQRLHDDLQTLGFFILSAWYGELVTEKEAAFDTILDPYGDQNALALDDKSTHWEERLRADGHGKLAVVVKYLFATLTAPRVRSRLTDRGVAGAYVQGVLGPLGELIWTR